MSPAVEHTRALWWDAGMIETHNLLDLSQCPLPEVFEGCRWPWEALHGLRAFLAEHIAGAPGERLRGDVNCAAHLADDVLIGEGTQVDPGAVILGPTVIGRECHVRANAYVRGAVLAGDGCVLGNACEFKNSVLLNGADVPHLSYVGDSVLGHRAHLGAGAKLSNHKALPGRRPTVMVRWAGQEIDTGLKKFGAVVGDLAEVGCNCVLNPGSVIGRGSVLYPNVSWRGVCPPASVVKLVQAVTVVEMR
jgi:acetyltransferase-like isoleucine patch superfamily enzyme